MELDISSRGLTTLKGIEFSPDITLLYCDDNRLTTLEGCPPNVTRLCCNDNQLTTLEGCPPNVISIICNNNPLIDQYKNIITLEEIHMINRIKAFKKGIHLLNNLIYALKIQRCWRKWWYDELDSEGVNRFIKKSFGEFNM